MNSFQLFVSICLISSTVYAGIINSHQDNIHSKLDASTPVIQSSSCGGILDGLAGAINYKSDEAVADGEICIWTVRTKDKSSIQFQVLEDGFNNSCSDCHLIRIFELNYRNKFIPTEVLQLTHGDRNIHQVNGPLIYIIFSSRLQTGYKGTGFSLLLAGVGEDMTDPSIGSNTYKFTLQHHDARLNPEPEYFIYPPHVDVKYQITSVVLQPARNKRLRLSIPAPFRTGYGHYNSYCGSPFSVQEIRWKETSTRLSYCRSEMDATSIVTSPMPLIVTFYNYVLYVPGFQFNWETVW